MMPWPLEEMVPALGRSSHTTLPIRRGHEGERSPEIFDMSKNQVDFQN